MKVIKRLLCAALVVVFALSFVACGKSEKETEKTEEITGGLTVNTDIKSQVTGEEKGIFDSAIKDYDGEKLEPIAVLASQVVAGRNLVYFCKTVEKSEDPFYLAVVYADLDGKATISSVSKFEVEKFMDNNQVEIKSIEQLAGGYTVNGALKETALSENDKEVFDRAIKGVNGIKYIPIALLATQVVSGENFMFLCVGTHESSANVLTVLTIYNDVSDKTCITSNHEFLVTDVISNDVAQ